MPIIVVIVSVGVILKRPGFLLGCIFCVFQFEAFYDLPTIIGPLSLIGFLAFLVFVIAYHGVLPRAVFLDGMISIFMLFYLSAVFHTEAVAYGSETALKVLVLCVGYYLVGRLLPHYYDSRVFLDFGASVVLLSLLFGGLAFITSTGGVRLGFEKGTAVGFSQMLDVAGAATLFYLLCKGGQRKFAVFLLFCAVVAVMVLNGTRGSILSLLLAGSAYAVVAVFCGQPGRMVAMLTVGLFAVVSALFVFQFVAGDLFDLALMRFTGNFQGTAVVSDPSTSVRFEFWRDAWTMFFYAPFFGNGLGAFHTHTGQGYPHNIFLELLVEGGIFTLFLFLSTLLVGSVYMIRVLRLGRFGLATSIVAGIFMVSLAHMQLSFSFWMAKPLFLSLGALAYMSSCSGYAASKSPPRPSSISITTET